MSSDTQQSNAIKVIYSLESMTEILYVTNRNMLDFTMILCLKITLYELFTDIQKIKIDPLIKYNEILHIFNWNVFWSFRLVFLPVSLILSLYLASHILIHTDHYFTLMT